MRKVSLAALADRKAVSLSWREGKVGFAKNRVEAKGPVDHALPILAVRSPAGDLRAVLANYAYHCTTLSHNKIHGRLLQHALAPLSESPSGSRKSIELAFDTLPTREQWLAKTAEAGIIGYHAKKNLERLDRGEVCLADSHDLFAQYLN